MEFSKPKNIFIVDDDEMLTEALKDYLTRKGGHNVSCFYTGETCLQELSDEVDVIILDYYLNTVQKDAANGMIILEAIRKNFPKIHVIMLSSQERYALAMETIQKGAEQYVIKNESAFSEIEEIIRKMA